MKIYEKCEGKEPEELDFALRLVPSEMCEGAVTIVAVDPATGDKIEEGNLVTIYPNGNVRLHWSINYGLGFDLDGDRRLKERE